MTPRHTEVCILGGGPAAILYGAMLSKKGIDSVTAAEAPLGMLTPISVDGVRVSPIPIFMRLNSLLFSRLRPNLPFPPNTLAVEYRHSDASQRVSQMVDDSYGRFLAARFPGNDLPLILAEKHLGPSIFTSEMRS